MESDCITFNQVASKKKSIKHDLPVHLGFFVYAYAKLRMLDFHFNVIDKFISRDDYCILEMDTGMYCVFRWDRMRTTKKKGPSNT